MHCPRCGQPQVSSETKFCSRCGFQLGLVAELLANGGFLPQLAELHRGKTTIFTRKNGVIFTALWFVFFVMMVPAFFGIADFEEGAAVSAVFGVFSTIMLLIISLGVLKRSPKAYELKAMEVPAAAVPLHAQGAQGALPPQQQQPASAYGAPQGGWRTPDTGELAQRGSVIENTTKLLKQDEK
jgi:hypothetical protein